MTQKEMEDTRGFFDGLITALANKQSEVDVNFQRTSVRFPGMPVGVEINGTITFSVHMRDLTDEEKDALASKNISSISKEKEQFSPLK
ncbi:MAG: hypothetical protein OK439_05355 [Thaumarchaeota archaeon]|nr:hypothetical protein [Nitrososphaerota archaeon]